MGCILETALPFFNERRALTDFHCVMYHIHPKEWKSHFEHIHVCGSLLPKQLMRRSFAGVDLFSAWRVAAVLRMSMTGSGAPVLCTQNPQPLQQLFQPQAKRRSQDRRNKEGLLQPLERENKRDRYLNCVCVCAEALTSIKSLNVWHLKCFNFLQYVMKMSN